MKKKEEEEELEEVNVEKGEGGKRWGGIIEWSVEGREGGGGVE